jgi:putative flippase GtrA
MPLRYDPAEHGVLAEAGRYVVNGVVATGVHYGALLFGMDVLHMASAGLANLGAAGVGITASFIGSRYFVFRNHTAGLLEQAAKFALLYGAIALLHALVLFLWTDLGQLDYRLGFVLALGLQMALSYWGNRRLVFT